MAFQGIWHNIHLMQYLSDKNFLRSNELLQVHLPSKHAFEAGDEPDTFKVSSSSLKAQKLVPGNSVDIKLHETALFIAERFKKDAKGFCHVQFYDKNHTISANLAALKERMINIVDRDSKPKIKSAMDRAIKAQNIVIQRSNPTYWNRIRSNLHDRCEHLRIRIQQSTIPEGLVKVVFFGAIVTAGIAMRNIPLRNFTDNFQNFLNSFSLQQQQ